MGPDEVTGEEFEPLVEDAVGRGFDHFETVYWQGPTTRVQPVVWPMRIRSRRQGNTWDGLSFGDEFRMGSYSPREDH